MENIQNDGNSVRQQTSKEIVLVELKTKRHIRRESDLFWTKVYNSADTGPQDINIW